MAAEPAMAAADGGKKKKRKQVEEADAELEAVADEEAMPVEGEKKKKRKHVEEPEEAAEPVVEEANESLADRKLSKKQKVAKRKAAMEALKEGSATDFDWAARHLEKAKKKQERLAQQTEDAKAAQKAKQEELAAREKANQTLKKKGKMTKKEKYLAAKAAKKAQAQKNAGADASFDLEKAMAAANIETVDPKAVSCFMTGLPYQATEKHIMSHFAAVGPSTVQLMTDKNTGKANGTGFITFSTAEMALHATTFTGTSIQNRWIKVRLCEPRDTGMGRAMSGPTEKPEGCLSVVVKCDPSISEASLKRFFSDCEVANVSRMTDRETGEFRGTAFLDFEDTAMVDEAVKKSGQSIKGLPILVRFKQEKKSEGVGANGGSVEETKKIETGKIAEHNRAPPVPAPTGKKTTFDSDDDGEEE